jgi:glycosyltransferase involved in cell wall biosynthesis
VKKYNILVLDNELGMGGSENLLYEFAGRVDRSRFDVKVCCLKEGGYFRNRLVDLGVPFYDRLLNHKYDALAFRKLARILEKESVDLIETFAHSNTVLFAYFAKTLGIVKRFVVSFHATGTASGGNLVRPYLKPFLREADALLALAREHKRYLAEREGLSTFKIEVIHNGVDTGTYFAGPPDEAVRRELAVDQGDTLVTTVASLKPLKGVDLLLRAARRVLRTNRAVTFLIVGDGPERSNLERLAGVLDIGERVRFVGVRGDVPALLRSSDMFVLSSRTEAFPLVVLEAMASGLPVVATGVGSVREMVEDGISAIVVPPEDSNALADAIVRIIDDEELARAFGDEGRRIVERRFRVETMCHKREELFARLLAGEALVL